MSKSFDQESSESEAKRLIAEIAASLEATGKHIGPGIASGLKNPPECGVHRLISGTQDVPRAFIKCSHRSGEYVVLYATPDGQYLVVLGTDAGGDVYTTRCPTEELAEQQFDIALQLRPGAIGG